MFDTTVAVQSLTEGFLPFVTYFVLGLAMLAGFGWLYMAATPHKELDLIKQNKSAAAISFGGALIGFALPIAHLIAQAVSVFDFLFWAIAAGVLQLAAFFLFRMVFPRISPRIEAGEMAAPSALAAMHVVVGLINAASLTY